MRYPFAYAVSLGIAFCVVLGHYLGGAGHFVLPFLGFVFLPFADKLAGHSRWPSAQALERIGPARERAYEAAIVAAALATPAMLGWALWTIATEPMTTWERAGLIVSTGMFTGYVGIVVAHDLMHRATLPHRLLAWLLMTIVLYPHFCIEHIQGHHPRVATPEDPATARRGESFYAFVPRSILGGLSSALRIEWKPVLLAYTLAAAAIVAIHHWLGAAALMLFLVQAMIAIVLLEGINYLEHYGLQRQKRESGRYEAVGVGHSWDTSYYLTNINIFNLGRHTDHHAHARRPYYRLRHVEKAPQLPFGYATMFMIALVPPLWFRLMDRRLDAWIAQSGTAPAAFTQRSTSGL